MAKKILLKNWQSPGDIVMLTAAIRDLHNAHNDKFEIGIDTSCRELFENSPYISKFPKEDADEVIKCDYPLIHQSNQLPYHFIHGFRQDLAKKLNVDIPQGYFKGDVHISDDEKGWMSQVAELGYGKKFWILMAGGKYDYTAKWWNPTYYQTVVDHFKDKIVFVQCGEKSHFHPPLSGTINLIGKTNLRQYIRLMYHAIGVISPVTFAMHLAAAVDNPHGLANRPAVILAGGREPAQWEQYPHHRFLSNNGSLPCCDNGGCWKSRCTTVGDGDSKDTNALCIFPEDTGYVAEVHNTKKSVYVPKCLNMIKPKHVIEAIESYYEGGVLEYEQFTQPEASDLEVLMSLSHKAANMNDLKERLEKRKQVARPAVAATVKAEEPKDKPAKRTRTVKKKAATKA